MARGEHDILTRVIAMLDISIDASRHLLSQVQFLRKYDYEAVNREYETIDDLEAQADREHRALVRGYCSGSFFGGIREDLLALLELIDNIADSAKGAGEIFYERQIPKPVIDYLFKEDVDAFISTCVATADFSNQLSKGSRKPRVRSCLSRRKWRKAKNAPMKSIPKSSSTSSRTK